MTLRSKFSFWIAGLIILMVAGVGSLVVVSERRLLEKEMRQHHHQMAQALANVCGESFYQSNTLGVLNYFKVLAQERGFLAACFTDLKGHVQIHSNPKWIGRAMASPNEEKIKTSNQVLTQIYPLAESEVARELAAPVFFAGNRVGTARLILSEASLQQFLNASLKQTVKRIGVIACLMLGLGLLATFWLARTMTIPIQHIIKGMEAVAQGRLEPFFFQERKDEIGWMAKQLNSTIAKLKELDEMKRDFVAAVTHELRSPLVAIEGFTNRLLGSAEKYSLETQKDFLLTIKNNSARLTRLVDDLLTTARLEAKQEELEPSSFDVADLLEEVQRLFRPLVQEKGLAFRLTLPERKLVVHADREKLFQVVTNLVSNALKFTEQGSVTISLGEKPDAFQITVADTGAGIPVRDREMIFSKFSRSPSTSKNVKGTGLGLFIAKGIVEAHGGSLHVEDNPGGGSRFVLMVPTAH